MALSIRAEQPGDEPVIDDLTATTFEPMPFSDGSEAAIIDALREDGEGLVGHVAFSLAAVGSACRAGPGRRAAEWQSHQAHLPPLQGHTTVDVARSILRSA